MVFRTDVKKNYTFFFNSLPLTLPQTEVNFNVFCLIMIIDMKLTKKKKKKEKQKLKNIKND